MTMKPMRYERVLAVVAVGIACFSAQVALEAAHLVDSIGLVYTVSSALVYTLVIVGAVSLIAALIDYRRSHQGRPIASLSHPGPSLLGAITSSTVVRVLMPLLAIAIALPTVYAIGVPRHRLEWFVVIPFYAAIVCGVAYVYVLATGARAGLIGRAKVVWVRGSLIVAFIVFVAGTVAGLVVIPALFVPSLLSTVAVWSVSRNFSKRTPSESLPP